MSHESVCQLSGCHFLLADISTAMELELIPPVASPPLKPTPPCVLCGSMEEGGGGGGVLLEVA